MHVALLWLSVSILQPLSVSATSASSTLGANSTDPLSTLLSIPECGQSCVIRGVDLKTDCQLTNATCLCASKPLEEWLVDCLMANCSVKDALMTKRITAKICDLPVRDIGYIMSWTGGVGGLVATVMVALRVLYRMPFLGGSFWLDDLFVLFLLFSLIPLSILSFCINHFGLGRDIWTVSFAHITDVLHITYWVEILYTLCLYFVKTSILLFYLRIFPDERFRRWLYLSLLLCFLHGAGFGLAVVFQCWPISHSWTGWTREEKGKCINVNVMFMVSAYVHIFLDLLVLMLPLQQLAQLTLNRWRRARVMFMFLVGSFATVASCIRIKHMKVLGRSHNPTWDYVPVGYWSTIEVDTATACACLPAVRALIYKVFFPQSMSDTPEEMDRSRYTMPGLPRSDGMDGKRAAANDRRDTCTEMGVEFCERKGNREDEGETQTQVQRVVIRRKSDERSEAAILPVEEDFDEERSDKSSCWGAAEGSNR
ncbi:uncharacterized protein J3D65DRAFT_625146 [Phyllosticta citribraziliensis]|uniref:CFEM domain-containing protein n=1 Tax=Phyllosticta citribraziliensis TaxID=989973 RepID=A0ABR1LRI2_9PEZI